MNDLGWHFAEPPNLAVFLKRPIAAGAEPIRLVTHEHDGSWTFLDGKAPTRDRDLMVVSLARVYEIDPSIDDVADLPRGGRASRESPGVPWMREDA